MDTIKISVIIPVYNAQKYLKQCIYSVVNQNEVFEIILVNDRSPDNSKSICLEYKQKFTEKIIYIENNENLGAGGSRNIGIKKAKGNYIAFLDADDFYYPDRFKKTVEVLTNHSDIDGTFGVVKLFIEDDESAKKHELQEIPTLTGEFEPDNLLQLLLVSGKGWIHLNALTVSNKF